VAARSTLKLWIRNWLGTSADDPAYADSVLDPSIQQAYDGLVGEMFAQKPDFLQAAVVTLATDASDGLVYTFTTQSTPLTDFAGYLEVRYNDKDGVQLTEARSEELNKCGTDYFAITGPDESAVLTLSDGSPTGTPLYFRYRAWPAELASDTDAPTAIPSRFQDVVALETLFAYGFGGEQRLPPELFARWTTRRAQLFAHIASRGVQGSRTRVEEPLFDD
jgi:hypothetical protein